MARKLLLVVVVALMVFTSAQTSRAVLNAVDPGPYVVANGFFPQWYQDTSAIALDLCLSFAAGANGPMCILLPDAGFTGAPPISFPGNFPSESFGTIATSAVQVK